MKEGYLGVDIGSVSTKGVIIDNENNIIASDYIWTLGNPVMSARNLIGSLKKQLPNDYVIKGIGTTGSARKLIGLLLDANVVKNEISAHGVGTVTFYPEVRTILEIGGQDSKIILLKNGVITNYAMNTLCAAGTGAFLSSSAKRLGLDVSEFGRYALKSKKPVKIASRCTVFAESDLVHKTQVGYKKEDIIAGLCRGVVLNYLNNVGKGKKIYGPIVFQGGVSKNEGVKHFFTEILGEEIITLENGHLMGAIGVAILARKHKTGKVYSLELSDVSFDTKANDCGFCSNNCELLRIYRNGKLVDSWGSKCGKY